MGRRGATRKGGRQVSLSLCTLRRLKGAHVRGGTVATDVRYGGRGMQTHVRNLSNDKRGSAFARLARSLQAPHQGQVRGMITPAQIRQVKACLGVGPGNAAPVVRGFGVGNPAQEGHCGAGPHQCGRSGAAGRYP